MGVQRRSGHALTPHQVGIARRPAIALAPYQIGMVVAGGTTCCGGLFLLFRRGSPSGVNCGNLTSPTRLSFSLLLLVSGYHAIIWAFPARLTEVQLNRQYWYVWSMIGIIAAGLATVMDRADRRTSLDRGDRGA